TRGLEIVDSVVAISCEVRRLKAGQRVNVGWTAEAYLHRHLCQGGYQNLCAESAATIAGLRAASSVAYASMTPDASVPGWARHRRRGPADMWVTVFCPLDQFGISPADRVGVVGMGGIGHLALKFTNAPGLRGSSSPCRASPRSVSGSPTGSALALLRMLELFGGRYRILPQTQHIPVDHSDADQGDRAQVSSRHPVHTSPLPKPCPARAP